MFYVTYDNPGTTLYDPYANSRALPAFSFAASNLAVGKGYEFVDCADQCNSGNSAEVGYLEGGAQGGVGVCISYASQAKTTAKGAEWNACSTVATGNNQGGIGFTPFDPPKLMYFSGSEAKEFSTNTLNVINQQLNTEDTFLKKVSLTACCHGFESATDRFLLFLETKTALASRKKGGNLFTSYGSIGSTKETCENGLAFDTISRVTYCRPVHTAAIDTTNTLAYIPISFRHFTQSGGTAKEVILDSKVTVDRTTFSDGFAKLSVGSDNWPIYEEATTSTKVVQCVFDTYIPIWRTSRALLSEEITGKETTGPVLNFKTSIQSITYTLDELSYVSAKIFPETSAQGIITTGQKAYSYTCIDGNVVLRFQTTFYNVNPLRQSSYRTFNYEANASTEGYAVGTEARTLAGAFVFGMTEEVSPGGQCSGFSSMYSEAKAGISHENLFGVSGVRAETGLLGGGFISGDLKINPFIGLGVVTWKQNQGTKSIQTTFYYPPEKQIFLGTGSEARFSFAPMETGTFQTSCGSEFFVITYTVAHTLRSNSVTENLTDFTQAMSFAWPSLTNGTMTTETIVSIAYSSNSTFESTVQNIVPKYSFNARPVGHLRPILLPPSHSATLGAIRATYSFFLSGKTYKEIWDGWQYSTLGDSLLKSTTVIKNPGPFDVTIDCVGLAYQFAFPGDYSSPTVAVFPAEFAAIPTGLVNDYAAEPFNQTVMPPGMLRVPCLNPIIAATKESAIEE